MTVSAFFTHDAGYQAQIAGVEDFLAGDVVAVLVDAAQTPNRATENTYADISANESADADYTAQLLAGKAISVEGTAVRVTCSKITFTADGSVSGQYVYLVYRAGATLASTDRILGHVDLQTEGGNVSSTNAEFSYTPNASGLFEIQRSA